MSVNTEHNQIPINFAWKGVSDQREPFMRVIEINLLFKGSMKKISNIIPKLLRGDKTVRLPYKCRTYRFGFLDSESTQDAILLTKEQINNLIIKAGILKKGEPIGPITIQPQGKTVVLQTTVRSDEVIPLETSENLEIGQTYCLLVTSNKLELSARLVKEEKPTTTFSAGKNTSKNQI